MHRCIVASSFLIPLLALTNVALAQTWSTGRTGPTLFEIIAVDASGEALWPYGHEDVAGDGLTTENSDEASVDLRSVYADARASRLWLRAYVAAEVAPTSTANAFFFIDDDAAASTGGPAAGSPLGVTFGADPTAGGYERAIGVRADGTLLGVFFWNGQKSQWVAQPDSPPLAAAETGVDGDPIQLISDAHGYFQVSLDLSVAGLDDACTGKVFVRLWNDVPKRSFGDDADPSEAACHASLDRFGDPGLLHSDVCSSDASCPAKGHCQAGICLFAYTCKVDADCRDAERCASSVCTRVVTKTCSDSGDCDGLVCKSDQCIACTSKSAPSCPAGAVCSPGGVCLGNGGPSAGSSANTGSAAVGGGTGDRVQGGAFHCAVMRLAASTRLDPSELVLAALTLCYCARRRRRGEAGGRR